MIRVILVDDVEQVRQALRERLNFEPDIEVIGEAENGEAALGLAARLQPDVVVLDVKMPQGDGIATARQLGAVVPGSRIVMLSLYDDPVNRARAKEAGAAAFIAKQDDETNLLAAIREK
jgi:DNA-binding NarL/FixJ family response regulator